MAHEPEPFAWNFCPICGDALTPHNDGERPRPHCARCRRFYYRNPVPAACCFVARGDALLLTRRAVEPCKGQWGLPGGFVEVGETTEEAVLRELEEETGLRGRGLRLIGASTQLSLYNGAVVVMGYVIEEWEGTVRAMSDVLEAEFFAPRDRPPLAFQAHRDLLAAYDALRAGEAGT